MRLAFCRRPGCRPRHARPPWIVRATRARWLVASFAVLSLGGAAGLLSPHAENSIAQSTPDTEIQPAAVASYFAPQHTTPPVPVVRTTPPQTLTRAADLQPVTLPRPSEPTPTPPAETDDRSNDRREIAELSGPDHWSPRSEAPHRYSPSSSPEATCSDSVFMLWEGCGEEDF